MLEGITVLNQSEVSETCMSNSGLFILIIACIVIGVLIGAATDSFGIGLFALFIMSIIGFGSCSHQEPTGRYRYECTIDESVSMKEVYERYEIIEQRGDIWVLEDKAAK